MQVELAHGGRGLSSSDRYSSYSSGGSRGGVSRRSEYRGTLLCNKVFNTSYFYVDELHVFRIFFLLHFAVLVTGLPSSASWQDLKVSMILLYPLDQLVGPYNLEYSDGYFLPKKLCFNGY